ncbi:MAG: hypothetical protein JXR03_08540 [Cyclobacteriaceae bacterium]
MMHFRSSKFIILIIGTIVLPVAVYVIFSVSKIKENEQVIEQIYKEQLDAIIFSINQYSTDILSAIIDDLASEIKSGTIHKADLDELLNYTGVDALFLKSLSDDGSFATLFQIADNQVESDQVDSILKKNRILVDRLIGYAKSGYRKIEPIETQIAGLGQLFFVIVEGENKSQFLLAGIIDPGQYIPEILSPRLQQITGEELIVAFTDINTDQPLFLTDSLVNDVILYEKMWPFKSIKVGLSSKNTTVSDLVQERLRANMIASGLLILLLLTGLTLIIRNLSRQMKLAQNKSDFVSNVSHELRTPLALISMFAETLSLNRVKSEDQRREYVDIIFRETSRLTNMVNRILNFSRIEANERTYQMAKFDIVELLERLVSDYTYHLDKNGFTCSLEVKEKNLEVFADEEAIYEAIVNLLDNAIKYSPDTKEISISLKAKDESIDIEVRDKGLGIPQEKLEDIFDKFYRVTQGDLYTVKGTGLGLSIVKHIVNAHNGSIKVTSEVGKGSCFILTFSRKEHA